MSSPEDILLCCCVDGHNHNTFIFASVQISYITVIAFVSSLPVLPFRYSSSLFLKCRLFSQITPLILPPFIGLGSCNHLNFAFFHYFNNFDQSFSNHGSWVVPWKIQEWQLLSALKINLLTARGVLHWSSSIWDLYTKLFFSSPFGSISGMHFLIYFLAVMTLVAEPLPVTQKASLSVKFVKSGIEKNVTRNQTRRTGRMFDQKNLFLLPKLPHWCRSTSRCIAPC